MLKNYFTTAWRNLVRNKAYSALNIFGLAIPMTDGYRDTGMSTRH
jgi:putative ABC transport system permease protein